MKGDVKKFSIFKNGIGIEYQETRKQVRDQRSIKAHKDDAQVLLENENK